MGRIKTKLVKRIGDEIYNSFPEVFTENFEENKKRIVEVATFNSKKLRNVVVGYITKLVKKSKQEKIEEVIE